MSIIKSGEKKLACNPRALFPRRGFTLVELLVALAIFSVMSVVAYRGLNAVLETREHLMVDNRKWRELAVFFAQMTDSSHELKRRLLSSWVAENRLAGHAAQPVWPDLGVKSGEVEQAGLPLRWEETVANTPNIAFRRIEIKVYARDHDEHALAQLVGYLGRGKD